MQKMSAKEVRAELQRLQTLVHKAEAFKAVTGGIPTSVLDAVDSALRVIVPVTAFLGDFELTTLLSGLKVWLQKKRAEAEAEDAQRNSFNDMGYSSYWS